MFADWISRNLATDAPEKLPPKGAPDEWRKAATFEEALRVFEPDDNPELRTYARMLSSVSRPVAPDFGYGPRAGQT
jgi:hypothetical protein